MIKNKIAWLIETFEGGNKTRFARRIGIKDGKSGLVHDWINGRSKPKASYQRVICQTYGVTIEWLNDDKIPCDNNTSSDNKVRVTGAIDAEKLTTAITELAETNKNLSDSNKVMSESLANTTNKIVENNKTMAESNRTLADTNAKLYNWIKKRDKKS